MGMVAGSSSSQTALSAVRTDLRDLVDRYALYVDRGEYERVAELFGSDGTLCTSVSAAVSGKDAIVASLRSALSWFAQQYDFELDGLRSHHFVGNHVCAIDGGQATGTAYCLARLGEPNQKVVILNVLRYEDSYQLTESGWRFRSRAVVRLWTEQPVVV